MEDDIEPRPCECGCGQQVSGFSKGRRQRRFVNGHNARGMKRSAAARQRMSVARTAAWATERVRWPLGTRSHNSDGYITVKVGQGKWVLQHRVLMAQMMGRPLEKEEVVHHIDCNKGNNTVTNLYLCRDKSHHAKVHASLDAAVMELMKAGHLRFKKGEYAAVL